jgi:hypothetical protein
MFVRKAPELTPCQPSSQAAIPDMTEGLNVLYAGAASLAWLQQPDGGSFC